MGLWSRAKCGLDNTERRMEHPKKKGARMLMTREISSRAHNLLSVKHATADRKRIGDKKKTKTGKNQDKWRLLLSLSSQHAPKDNGSAVWRQQRGQKMDQWTLCHQVKGTKKIESFAENIALVVGEKGCKSTSPRLTIM